MEYVKCSIQCIDGQLELEIPQTQLETSSILQAMIMDIGLEPGEMFPIPCFQELTILETRNFIQAWLETIPNTQCSNYTCPPEYTINSHPFISVSLDSAISASQDWLDYLAEHNFIGPTLAKYDMRLISKYTKPANFLDLQAILSILKLILAKQYREIAMKKDKDKSTGNVQQCAHIKDNTSTTDVKDYFNALTPNTGNTPNNNMKRLKEERIKYENSDEYKNMIAEYENGHRIMDDMRKTMDQDNNLQQPPITIHKIKK